MVLTIDELEKVITNLTNDIEELMSEARPHIDKMNTDPIIKEAREREQKLRLENPKLQELIRKITDKQNVLRYFQGEREETIKKITARETKRKSKKKKKSTE